MATSLLSAYERFRARSLVDISMAAVFLAWIVVVQFAGALTSGMYVAGLAAGYGLSGAAAFLLMRVSWRFPGNWGLIAKRLMSYGLIGAASGVVAALLNSSSRLVANRFLSLDDVGILSAYLGGSVQMAFFLVTAIAQVFFPIASRTPDKNALLKKITRVMMLSLPLSTPVFGGGLIFYFLLLGKGYSWNLSTVVVFAVASSLTCWWGILGWYLGALGRRGLMAYSFVGLLAGACTWLACVVLIPQWGVSGAGAAQAAGYAMGIVLCHLPFVRRLMQRTW